MLTEDGLRALALEELFRTWVRFVYLLVGMENALTADYGFTTSVTTLGEDPRELTPFKAQYVIEAHRRFLVSYLDGLVHEDLRTLWQLTVGFCDPHLDIRSFDTDLAAMSARPDVGLVRHSVAAVKEQLLAGDDFRLVTALCRLYAHADVRLLRDLKTAVLEGVRAFEIHEADVVEQAGATLLNAARRGARCGLGLLPAPRRADPRPRHHRRRCGRGDDPGRPGPARPRRSTTFSRLTLDGETRSAALPGDGAAGASSCNVDLVTSPGANH